MSWLGAMNAAAKGIQLVVRGADLVIEVDRLIESREFNDLKTASVATRTTLLFLGIAEMALAIANQSRSSGALTLKSIETFAQAINLPVQFVEATNTLSDPNASLMDKVRIVEKKMLCSLMSFVRSVSENEHLTQMKYRDLSPEEQAKLQLPIYEMRGEDFEIVGYKPFNKEECLQAISKLEACIPKMNVLEAGLEMGVGSKIIGITLPAFNLLVARVAAFAGNAPPPGTGAAGGVAPQVPFAAPQVPLAAPQAPLNVGGNDDDDGFDRAVTNSLNTAAPAQPIVIAAPQQEADLEDRISLRRFHFIPLELHEDGVFKQFVCAITQMPIRFIAGDPTSEGSPIYYEKAAIQTWLRQNRFSPMTRKPLSLTMLKPCVALQSMINMRLDTYSATIRAEIERRGLLSHNQESVNETMRQDQ